MKEGNRALDAQSSWVSWIAELGAVLLWLLGMGVVTVLAVGIGIGVSCLCSGVMAHMPDSVGKSGGAVWSPMGVVLEVVLGVGAVAVLLFHVAQAVIFGFRERRQRLITAGPIASIVLVILQSFGSVVGAFFLSVLAAGVVCVVMLYLS